MGAVKTVVMASMLVAMTWMVASTEAAITCATVTSKIAPCLSYVTKQINTVPQACCPAIASLNSMARSTPDRQQACRCLQSTGRSFGSSIDMSRASGLPGLCHVSVPFPISLSTNCNTVK